MEQKDDSGLTVNGLIKQWQSKLRIEDWTIRTEQISPESVDYNDENYFIGIERDFESKIGIIYHDVELYEEAIVHELLHIVYPQLPDQTFEEYERFIEWKTVRTLEIKDKLVY